jgi:hypothetical protein
MLFRHTPCVRANHRFPGTHAKAYGNKLVHSSIAPFIVCLPYAARLRVCNCTTRSSGPGRHALSRARLWVAACPLRFAAECVIARTGALGRSADDPCEHLAAPSLRSLGHWCGWRHSEDPACGRGQPGVTASGFHESLGRCTVEAADAGSWALLAVGPCQLGPAARLAL